MAKGNTGFAYDPVGNLTNIDYPASTDVRLKYDPLNRLTNMVDAAGTTTYTYTSGNQLQIENGPFADDTVTNTYLNRLRTSLALQQGTGTTPLWTNKFVYISGPVFFSVRLQIAPGFADDAIFTQTLAGYVTNSLPFGHNTAGQTWLDCKRANPEPEVYLGEHYAVDSNSNGTPIEFADEPQITCWNHTELHWDGKTYIRFY